ncbi:hypothetical protein [Levilactobacillus sp. HBUAS70063]|uniref:hypothetical protein n=1 Tax=Levilactobacillus sp. HBUAS70063 TaxID=3109359 RepID=UPI00313310ED
MTMQRQSLGAVLYKARLILADGASYEDVLKNLDIPAWYLHELEQGHITHPNPDLLALIFQCYGLNYQQVAALQRAKDLTTALFELTISDNLRLAANHHQAMDWPDSAAFAAKHGVVKPTDPHAVNSYADILRCLRLADDYCPIHTASLIYGVSPMVYWQMEAAQIPVSPQIVAVLAEQLRVDSLQPFLEAPDLTAAVERQLRG